MTTKMRAVTQAKTACKTDISKFYLISLNCNCTGCENKIKRMEFFMNAGSVVFCSLGLLCFFGLHFFFCLKETNSDIGL